MSRRKTEQKNIRKLTRVGGTSLSVTIPADFVDKLKFREKQKVTVSNEGRKLIVKDWKKKKPR